MNTRSAGNSVPYDKFRWQLRLHAAAFSTIFLGLGLISWTDLLPSITFLLWVIAAILAAQMSVDGILERSLEATASARGLDEDFLSSAESKMEAAQRRLRVAYLGLFVSAYTVGAAAGVEFLPIPALLGWLGTVALSIGSTTDWMFERSLEDIIGDAEEGGR